MARGGHRSLPRSSQRLIPLVITGFDRCQDRRRYWVIRSNAEAREDEDRSRTNHEVLMNVLGLGVWTYGSLAAFCGGDDLRPTSLS